MPAKHTLHLSDGTPVELHFKRVKRFNLSVNESGRVRLSAPSWLCIQEANTFLTAHEGWIFAQRAKLAKSSSLKLHQLPAPLTTGSTIYLWGQPMRCELNFSSRMTSAHTTHHTRHKADKPGVVELWLPERCETLPQQEQQQLVEKLVIELWRQELNARLPYIQAEAERATGLIGTSWRPYHMQSRWGSCTPSTKRIRLAVRLAAYPQDCAVYVAIHELCHLVEANHSARFHALVETACPNWRELRAQLDSGRTS